LLKFVYGGEYHAYNPDVVNTLQAAVQQGSYEKFKEYTTLVDTRPVSMIRDLLQVKAIDYPVFTGSTICSHAYCHILHVGLPVSVGGLVVNTGDLLHGDANGVTRIPLEIAEAVAEFAGPFVDAEKIVLDYVNGSGAKTVAGLAAARKEFSAAVAKLVERVKKRG